MKRTTVKVSAKEPLGPPQFRSAHKQRVAAAIHAEHHRPRGMKTLTVRLPISIVAEIERESKTRCVSKSDVVRERLRQPHGVASAGRTVMDLCGDLLGSVKGLPPDLSSEKKKYLPQLIRARKNHR